MLGHVGAKLGQVGVQILRGWRLQSLETGQIEPTCPDLPQLGPTWPAAGPSWSHVGPTWRHVGPSWPQVGLSWTYVGRASKSLKVPLSPSKQNANLNIDVLHSVGGGAMTYVFVYKRIHISSAQARPSHRDFDKIARNQQ